MCIGYITDKMRQDGSQIEALSAMRAKEATRAIQEHFETRALATLNDAQTPNDANTVNDFAHRMVGTGPNATLTIDDLIYLRLSANKGEVPNEARMGIVDPIVEATFNQVFQIQSGTGDLAANSVWQDITESGIDRDHTFVTQLFGWQIMTSNRLPKVATESIDIGDGAVSVTGGVANIFMCVADDGCKPLMAAWREMPSVEGGRNWQLKRDEFVESARFGLGVQRTDTLFVVVTSDTEYK